MAMSWSKILEVLPKLARGMLPGLIVSGSPLARGAEKTLARAGLKGAVWDYPDLPGDFNYPITNPINETWVDGKKTVTPAKNLGVQRGYSKSALVQTLQQHNKGIADGNERSLERWWPGEDTQPRIMFNPNSTAVDGVQIVKDAKTGALKIQVKWIKGSKWYTYNGGDDLLETTEIARDLLTAPSIGRALVRKGKLFHTDSKDLLGKPTPAPESEIGWWGREYYDAAAAGGKY